METFGEVVNKFLKNHNHLKSPAQELESIWYFLVEVLGSRYRRIRFYVAAPGEKMYYGFKSWGMDRDFQNKFDCNGVNPYLAKRYPIKFGDVPKDIRHPIEGSEKSYLLKSDVLKQWCDKGNQCPSYINELFVDFRNNRDIIDEAFTIHIPHPQDEVITLGALTLDFGRTGIIFSDAECANLQAMVGTFLGAFIAPLIELEMRKVKNDGYFGKEVERYLDDAKSKGLMNLGYEEPLSKYGLVFDDKNDNHPFIKKEVFKRMEAAFSCDSSVFITGKSGTGKDAIARAIHKHSARSKSGKKLLGINCSSLSEQLIENELFGHEKGSFTSANSREIGLFELQAGSTLFLDEIGTMPIQLQPKLLRALEEKQIRRLGGRETIKVDVRIISATLENIEENVKAGKFRQDLYYRLNVIEINIPPLKERKSDILPLIRYFLKEKIGMHPEKQLFQKELFISGDALNVLIAWDWEANNVRELRNFVEQMIVYTLKESDTILKSDIPAKMKALEIEEIVPNESKILLYVPMFKSSYEDASDEDVYEDLLKIDTQNFPPRLKEIFKIQGLKERFENILRTKKAVKFYFDWVNKHSCEECSKKVDSCKTELGKAKKCIYNDNVIAYPTFMERLKNAGLSIYKKNGE